MLRIHLLLQWFSLCDPAMEEALIEAPTMRGFSGIDLMSERIPDERSILTVSFGEGYSYLPATAEEARPERADP